MEMKRFWVLWEFCPLCLKLIIFFGSHLSADAFYGLLACFFYLHDSGLDFSRGSDGVPRAPACQEYQNEN